MDNHRHLALGWADTLPCQLQRWRAGNWYYSTIFLLLSGFHSSQHRNKYGD